MICCQFFDAGPWVHGLASNVLNLCNLLNLRILHLRNLGSMIGPSDRGLSALSGPNTNRFLDRNDKHPTVVNSSGSSLTDNGLNRAPNTIIRDHDFKLKLGQKLAEILAAARHGGMICAPAQHLYLANGYPFDSDFNQGFSYLVHSERFDNRLDLFHPMQTLRRLPLN
jgi:hypothetical protein